MNATSDQIDLTARATVPKHVLIQEIAGQSAILDLQADKYFGLDDVGTEVWRAVTNGSTVQEGIDSMAALYDVEYDRLRKDVVALLVRLRTLGLLEFE
jgi:hypothetical protein